MTRENKETPSNTSKQHQNSNEDNTGPTLARAKRSKTKKTQTHNSPKSTSPSKVRWRSKQWLHQKTIKVLACSMGNVAFKRCRNDGKDIHEWHHNLRSCRLHNYGLYKLCLMLMKNSYSWKKMFYVAARKQTKKKQGINYTPTANPLLFVFSFAKKVLVFVRKKNSDKLHQNVPFIPTKISWAHHIEFMTAKCISFPEEFAL